MIALICIFCVITIVVIFTAMREEVAKVPRRTVSRGGQAYVEDLVRLSDSFASLLAQVDADPQANYILDNVGTDFSESQKHDMAGFSAFRRWEIMFFVFMDLLKCFRKMGHSLVHDDTPEMLALSIMVSRLFKFEDMDAARIDSAWRSPAMRGKFNGIVAGMVRSFADAAKMEGHEDELVFLVIFDRDVANYALVEIEAPDLEGITDNGKEVLNLYRFAADEADAIYWEQYFGDKKSLLDGITDPAQKTFAQINYGPWDRATGKSFVEGYPDRLPGAGFYPADMTAEEFESWDNPDKDSPYTLVRRSGDGSLETVWYHDAYKEHIDKIADYLEAAADITIKPSVAAYLRSKAEALKTDRYYESSLAWLEMEDSKMDLVIGPNEVTDDQLLGIKRSYEAFVLLKNQAHTQELMQCNMSPAWASSRTTFRVTLPTRHSSPGPAPTSSPAMPSTTPGRRTPG